MNPILAQNTEDTIFKGRITNKEYNIFIDFNLYEKDIKVPLQEIFGEMAGYIKYKNDGRCWIIVTSEIDEKHNTAQLEIINDYGSEDLVATLKYTPQDQTYTLTQQQGSTIKFAKGGKWMKIPKQLTFQK